MKVSEYGRKLFRHRATVGLPSGSSCGSVTIAPIFPEKPRGGYLDS